MLWESRYDEMICKKTVGVQLHKMLVCISVFIGFVAISGLLWWFVVPVPQCLLVIALHDGWRDVLLVARTAVGMLLPAMSTAMACSARVRSTFVRTIVRDAEKEQVKYASYLNVFSRSEAPRLVATILGAALVVAGYEVLTGWVRGAPNGSFAWAKGVLPFDANWAAALVVSACAGVTACFCAISRAPRFAEGAAMTGVLASCALGLFSCGPDVVFVVFPLLFGVQFIGGIFEVQQGKMLPLRALIFVELMPLLTIVSSAVEHMVQIVFADEGETIAPFFVLLLAMNSCALAALAIRCFHVRKESDGASTDEFHLDYGQPLCDAVCMGQLDALEAYGLSERERAVLIGSMQGKSLAHLARELGVSRSTAGTYRLRAYAKIDVESLDGARAVLGELCGAHACNPEHPDPRSLLTSRSDALTCFVKTCGWIAWFVLAGTLFLPWYGSRVWLFDEAWNSFPAVVLALGSGYLVLDDFIGLSFVRFGARVLAIGCSVFLLPMTILLSGEWMAPESLPFTFDTLLAVVLAFGLTCLMRRRKREETGLIVHAAAASGISAVFSVFPVCYIALVVFSLLALVVVIFLTCADDCDESFRRQDDVQEKRRESLLRSIDFVPRGGQVVCLVVGFSIFGWGLSRSGTFVLMDFTRVIDAPSAMIACSFVAYACLFCLLLKGRQGDYWTSLRWSIPVAWFMGLAIPCVLQVSGASGAASPLGHMMVEFPMLVLLGEICGRVAAFREEYGFVSFWFALPVASLCIVSIWCIGPLFAGLMKGYTDDGLIVAITVVSGGFLGAISLRHVCRTMCERASLGSAGSRVIERALGRAGLTEAESRVVALLCSGRSTREVASELFVECSTVRSHIRRVYGKLAVHTRAELESAVAALVREKTH